jgi:hypothetical protein
MPSQHPNPDTVRVDVRVTESGNRCGTATCQGCQRCQGIFIKPVFFMFVVFFRIRRLQNYSIHFGTYKTVFFSGYFLTLTTLTTLTKTGNIRVKPRQGSDFYPDVPCHRNDWSLTEADFRSRQKGGARSAITCRETGGFPPALPRSLPPAPNSAPNTGRATTCPTV